MPFLLAVVLLVLSLAAASPAAAEKQVVFSKDSCPSAAHENVACVLHTVGKGESLWGIVANYRKNGHDLIPQAILALPENKFIFERKIPFHKLGKNSGIKKPQDYLLPGDKIVLPRVEGVSSAAPPPAKAEIKKESREAGRVRVPDVPRINIKGVPPENFNPIVSVAMLRKETKQTAEEKFWIVVAGTTGLGFLVGGGVYLFFGRVN